MRCSIYKVSKESCPSTFESAYTYYRGKKRPTIDVKETYYRCKRDLLQMNQRTPSAAARETVSNNSSSKIINSSKYNSNNGK